MNRLIAFLLLSCTALAFTILVRAAVALPADAPEPVWIGAAVADAGAAGQLDAALPASSVTMGEVDAVPAPSATIDPTAPPVPDADPIGTAGEVLSAVKDGRWRDVLAGLLILVMFGLKRLRGRWDALSGDRGGAITLMALSLAAGTVLALKTSADLADWRLWVGVVTGAWTAAGAYTWLKRFLWPKDGKAWGPAWLRRLFEGKPAAKPSPLRGV